MNLIKSFPSKILLFGEYSILSGGQALIVPNSKHAGFLYYNPVRANAENMKSNAVLKELLDYLLKKDESIIDLDLMKKDVNNGLYFHSSIPPNYGLGSSGALTAAIFDRYSIPVPSGDLSKLKKQLAIIESFFHGNSSGADPLTSLTGKPLIFDGDNIQVADMPFENKINLFLFDTHIPRSTSGLVQKYLEKYSLAPFRRIVEDQLKPSVQGAIRAYLTRDKKNLLMEFEKISSIQSEHFKEMIPVSVRKTWQQGLETRKYFLKLCGAGGGGYLLGTAVEGWPDFEHQSV